MLNQKENTALERPFSPSAATRLYAFTLKLRPLQYGTLMPFCGELVHGAFLNWLRAAAPDVATWLHEGHKRRLFTCSSLQWPLPSERMHHAESGNVHMPVEPEKTYTVRITLLLGELFPLFHKALMDFNIQSSVSTKPPFMRIGKQLFLLEEVIIDNNDPSGWTGFTSLSVLVEQASTLKLGKAEPLTLEFDSVTTFSRSGGPMNGGYDSFSGLLPLSNYIFPGLAKRWGDVAPPELASLIQKERIEDYTLEDGVIIVDYALRPHQIKFTTHPQPGFLGICKYQLRRPLDETTTPDAPLTVRQQILLLAQLAFYSGIGYKTSMGLGRARPI